MRGECYLLLLDLDIHGIEDGVEHHLAVGDALHELVGEVDHIAGPAPARGPHLHTNVSVKSENKQTVRGEATLRLMGSSPRLAMTPSWLRRRCGWAEMLW